MPHGGSLLQRLPTEAADEVFETLVRVGDVGFERIVSTGQATPPGEWYDQTQHEFVVVLTGAASVRLATEQTPRDLTPGDWLWIPARCWHRVEYTCSDPTTVWLAIFVPAEG